MAAYTGPEPKPVAVVSEMFIRRPETCRGPRVMTSKRLGHDLNHVRNRPDAFIFCLVGDLYLTSACMSNSSVANACFNDLSSTRALVKLSTASPFDAAL